VRIRVRKFLLVLSTDKTPTLTSKKRSDAIDEQDDGYANICT
jgi:hypothetical protein